MTGAPHSSVKRYRELARTPSTNGADRALLLDGPHLLFEARRSGVKIESAAFEHSVLDDPPLRALADALVKAGTEVLIVSRKTLEAMSPVRTPSGVVSIARHSLSPLDRVLDGPAPLVVVAHDLQDPGNVGGIMRSAEAAGATAFIATPSTADPLGWKALRGSMGSALRLPVARASFAETLSALERRRIVTTALVPRGGEPLFSIDFRTPTALILGSEGAGVPHAVLPTIRRRVSIPMAPAVESLNVGVAAALVLYEAFRQRA